VAVVAAVTAAVVVGAVAVTAAVAVAAVIDPPTIVSAPMTDRVHGPDDPRSPERLLMNPRSYRMPIKPLQTHARCPVCQQAVYSRAGIHPQCAVRQNDPPKVKKVTPAVTTPSE
jgi:hypothetical protein